MAFRAAAARRCTVRRVAHQDSPVDEPGGTAPSAPAGRRHLPRYVVVIWMAAVISSAFSWVGLGDSGMLSAGSGPVFPATATGPDALEAAPTDGEFLFTTVEYRRVSRAGAVLAMLTGTELVGSLTEQSAQSVAMAGSKQMAIAVAAARVRGEQLGVEARIVDVEPGSASDKAGLLAGDRVLAVDGAVMENAETTIAALSEKVARTLSVRRAGEVLLIDIPAVRPIGISLISIPLGALPEVALASSDVGGSSAGLMFTLATIDALTEGDLTAGMRIAGTGTIRPNGTVGTIAGVEHKRDGARAAGATVFFAPSSIAPSSTGGLSVVGVDTLDDALAWLCRNGSAPACALAAPADGGALGTSPNRSSGLPAADAAGRKEQK